MDMPSRLEITMEDIPDITSDILDKLKELHIDSVFQLAVQVPIELALKMGDDEMDVEVANRLVTNARKVLTEHESLSRDFLTADEMLEKRNKISRYKTGSEKFDAFLNGGFESQSITELAGEFGSGKSQVCHALCIALNKFIQKDDTTERDKNKKSAGNVIYIDTENTFRSERVYQIAEQNGLDPLAILETIYHCNVFNSEELESIIDNLDKFIEQYNAKLLIVDSIISLHRAEFSGRGTLAERQQRIGRMLSKLRRYADIYNIAVIITNQVVSYTDGSQFGINSMKAAGGNIMGHGSTYRIFLKKAGKNRVAIMYDSPYHAYEQIKFSISENGIQNSDQQIKNGDESAW